MIATRVIRKVRRLTISHFFTALRALVGLSVPLWWEPGAITTYIFLATAVTLAQIAWFLEPGYRYMSALSLVFNPLADKLFILPIFWFVGVTTLDWALLVLALYTTVYDISNTWQRRIALSFAWKGLLMFSLPTTALSRTKTVFQYVLVGMLATPSLHPYIIAMMIIMLVMTVVAWEDHRRQTMTML